VRWRVSRIPGERLRNPIRSLVVPAKLVCHDAQKVQRVEIAWFGDECLAIAGLSLGDPSGLMVLHGGPKTLGLLMSSTGCGAIMGALYMAARTRVSGLSRVITASTIMYSLALILFSFSHSVHLSMLALAATGAGMLMSVASTNTSLQTIVPDALRGRVVGFYGMMFMGMAPIGSLLAGWLAGLIGAPVTVASGAVICIIAALIFNHHRPVVRAALRQAMMQQDMGMVPVPAPTPEESVSERSRAG